MPSVYSRRRIQRIIEFRNLHTTVPVPIRQLAQDEGWRILFRSRIHPLYGFAVVQGIAKIMCISEDISHPAQRYVMAHEFAHDLLGHVGSLHMCGEWPWAHDKQEYRADNYAAQLLIPDWSIEEYKEVELIAAACEVPEWLVRQRVRDPEWVRPSSAPVD